MKRTAWKMLANGLVLAAWLTVPAQAVFADALQTAIAERVEVPRVYRLDGVIEAANQSTVSAQTSGQVTQVNFDVDDLVEAGDVIVVIEDSEQAASLASARANLASAQARQAEAEKEYARIKRVFDKQAVSQSAMDKASAARKSARAQVDSAKAALAQAEQQLGYTQVTAPYTGIVTERFVEVGEVASRGQRLMSGISLEQLRVVVDVPQSLINSVRRQKHAMVQLNNEWVPATKVTIFPVADQATDSFRVRLELPTGIEGVFPGMYVKVAMKVGTRSALLVPHTAVVFRSEVIGVYVVDAQGLVSLRHVRVGTPLPDRRYSILSGLDAGERVAVDPQAAVELLKKQRMEHTGHE